MMSGSILLSGSSNPALAQEIAALLEISLGKVEVHTFPDKEINVEIKEKIQGRHVFVLQSIALDPNVYLVELLIILDALKRAAAGSVTVILPYYGYARQDRLEKPGTAIAAKLVANLLAEAGTQHVITLDLHSEQIEGFFDIPVDQVLSRDLLIPYCAALKLENLVVVAPDKGGIKIASAYAKQLKAPMALIDKERVDAYQVKMVLFIGDVHGRTVLLPDDMCSTAGTLVKAATVCAELGAKRIIAVVGHGLFIGDALENIRQSPIEMVISTNSILPIEPVLLHSKIRVISVAPLFAQAISKMFV